jgi:hypothetical protein
LFDTEAYSKKTKPRITGRYRPVSPEDTPRITGRYRANGKTRKTGISEKPDPCITG